MKRQKNPEYKATWQQVCQQAQSFDGIPYLHQGRDPSVGIDCAGLVVCTCKKFGLPHTDRTDYAPIPDGVSIEKMLDEHAIRMDDLKPEPGRVLVFWMSRASMRWQHFGIALPNQRFVHALQVRESRNTPPDRVRSRVKIVGLRGEWVERLCATYRFKEVEYEWLR